MARTQGVEAVGPGEVPSTIIVWESVLQVCKCLLLQIPSSQAVNDRVILTLLLRLLDILVSRCKSGFSCTSHHWQLEGKNVEGGNQMRQIAWFTFGSYDYEYEHYEEGGKKVTRPTGWVRCSNGRNSKGEWWMHNNLTGKQRKM